MSSFICANGVCTFTRVDTDGFTYVPYPTYNPYPYYTFSPAPVSSPIDDPAFNETFNVTNDKDPMEGDDSIPMEDDFDGSNASGEYYDPYGNGYYDEYGNFIPYYGGEFGNDTIAPWTDEANQDMLSATVAITRDFRGGVFNALVEWDQHNDYSAPTGTEWAILPEGQTFEEARCSMRFCNWLDCFAHYDIKSYLNKPGIVHLIEEDEYYNIMFTNWTSSRDESPFYNRRLKEQKKQGRRTQEEGQKKQDRRTREGQKQERRTQEEGQKQERRTQEEGQKKQGRRNQEGPMEERAQEIPSRTSDSGSATTQSHEDEYCGYSGCYNDDSYYGGGYGSLETLGGGFQYVRDQSPIVIDESLPDCPSCRQAKASPAVLTGRVDDSFQEVSIVGVTPVDSDVDITITAVGQDSSPRCNLDLGDGMVRPNAKGVGNSTVMLRRTRVPGQLDPYRYTVFFKASNEAGSCNGQATVCSPLEGLDDCNYYYYGYDATATSFCDYY